MCEHLRCLRRMVPLMLLAAASATASLITVESFSYTNGSSLSGAGGGSGWSGAWALQSSPAFGAFSVSPTGVALGANGGSSSGAAEGRFLASDMNSGTVWVEFNLEIATIGGGFPNVRFYENGTLEGGVGSNQGLTSNYYLLDAALDGSSLNTHVALSQSTFHTALLEINYGATQTYLWMDPNAGSFTGDTSTATVTGSFAPQFNKVALFGHTGDRFGAVRIGTTYQDALNIPEPAACGLIGLGLLAAALRRVTVGR